MNKKTNTSSTINRSVGIKVLFGVLGSWAILIAAGAVWGQKTGDVRKPLIILLTMAVFLGVWAIALRSKKNR